MDESDNRLLVPHVQGLHVRALGLVGLLLLLRQLLLLLLPMSLFFALLLRHAARLPMAAGAAMGLPHGRVSLCLW